MARLLGRSSGRLRRLALYGLLTLPYLGCGSVPHDEPPPVELDLIAELDRASENLNHEIRRSALLIHDRPLTLDVTVPCGRRLHLGFGARVNNREKFEAAAFTFELSNDRETEILLERRLRLPESPPRWHDVTLPAPSLCGEVNLKMTAHFLPPEAVDRTPRQGKVVQSALAQAEYLPEPHPVQYALLVSHLRAESTARTPTLTLLLIDTLRADALSGYGALRPSSPHLDRLSRQGRQYARAVSAATWTRSSVASLFTSRIPYEHGALTRDDVLTTELPTLAEALLRNGVTTAGFVANGNVGFQRQYFHRGFDHWILKEPDDPDGKTRGEELVDRLQTWLDRAPRPTFAYVQTVDPHAPYGAPPPFFGLWNQAETMSIDGTLHKRRGFRNAQTPEELAHVRALYDEEVLYGDWVAGRLRRTLRRHDSAPSLIVLSDHGESFLDHEAWEHGTTLFEPEMHVPLILFGDAFAPGLENRPATLLDVGPTVCRFFGVSPPEAFGGSPLGEFRTPLVAVQKLEGREMVALESAERKAILDLTPTPGLAAYDLPRDPGETAGAGLPWNDPLAVALRDVVQKRAGLTLAISEAVSGDVIEIRGAASEPSAEACIGCAVEAAPGVVLVSLEQGDALVLLEPGLSELSISVTRRGEPGWEADIGDGDWDSDERRRPRVRATRRDGVMSPTAPPSPEELEALRALGYLD